MNQWVKLAVLFLLTSSALAAPLSSEPNRVLYQIYPESFQDGALADGEGDFQGIEMRLGYLHDLGVTGVLLMPVFQGTGGMGYISSDFYRLRREYLGLPSDSTSGQDEAVFQSLTAAAHRLGIKVFLDIPINHISIDSTWFRQSESQVPGFENFFLWEERPEMGWKVPWDPKSGPGDVFHFSTIRKQYYYALFGWGMPDLNHRLPEMQEQVDAIFKKWADLGADGYRIDAAKHLVEGKDNLDPVLPDNLARIRSYLETLRVSHPDQSFLLEAWSDQYSEFEPYVPDSGDLVFDFAYMDSVRDSVRNDHPWAVRRSLEHMEETQSHIRPGNRIVFAGNHDVPRIRTAFGNDVRRNEVALALTFSLPFIPMVYYGDEIFMPGDYIRSDNPAIARCEVGTPMAWEPVKNAGFTLPSFNLGNDWNKKIHSDYGTYNVKTEWADSSSLLNFVRALIAERTSLAYSNDSRIKINGNDPSDPVLDFTVDNGANVLSAVLINFSPQPQAARTPGNAGHCQKGEKIRELVSRRSTFDVEKDAVTLGAYGIWWGECLTP